MKIFVGILVCIGVMVAMECYAGESTGTVIKLWPKGVNEQLQTLNSDVPELLVFPAGKACGTAVIICPGGGYGNLCQDYEGTDIAEWFNEQGITACVLRYRHADDGCSHPAPVQDVQRAIRLVRAHANEWELQTDQIGIMGFSAGGHLAACGATMFGEQFYKAVDQNDSFSCRPDFAILMYPVISMQQGITHGGSRKNLLGKTPAKELIEKMSAENRVTPKTPPTFLLHTNDDTVVPAENSLRFLSALRKAGVDAEMHLYQKGPHGIALGGDYPVVKAWKPLLLAWMKGLHLVR